jgi:hypothetical protein
MLARLNSWVVFALALTCGFQSAVDSIDRGHGGNVLARLDPAESFHANSG